MNENLFAMKDRGRGEEGRGREQLSREILHVNGVTLPTLAEGK